MEGFVEIKEEQVDEQSEDEKDASAQKPIKRNSSFREKRRKSMANVTGMAAKMRKVQTMAVKR